MAKSKAKPAKKVAPKKAAKPVKKAAPKAVAKKLAASKVHPKKTVKSPTTKPKVTEKKTTKKTALPPIKLSANDNDVIANAKVRFAAKDLEVFKKLIIEQREEAKEEFDIISQQLLDTSGEYDGENQSFALHTAEQGSDAMEREKQYLQAQRTSDFIKKLDEALERIDRGTYGICVICGNLIEKQRLAAVPITQKHVICKNKTNVRKVSSSSDAAFQTSEESSD